MIYYHHRKTKTIATDVHEGNKIYFFAYTCIYSQNFLFHIKNIINNNKKVREKLRNPSCGTHQTRILLFIDAP